MPEHRRKFSPQFKAEAVQMVIETGKPIAEVARDLGIHDGTLGNWVNAWRRENPEPDQPLSPVERARVKELEAEVARLMSAASGLEPYPYSPLRPEVVRLAIVLLYTTGLRVGEAIRLDRADIDWASAVLTIRESKFGKTRMVPVLGSTLARLECYARTRDRLCPHDWAAGVAPTSAVAVDAVGQISGKEFGEGRHTLGNALDQSQLRRPRAQRNQKRRQHPISHL